MSMYLYNIPAANSQQPSSSQQVDDLRLLCAYENGSVALRRYARTDKLTSVEGIGWEVIWSVKLHVESSTSRRSLHPLLGTILTNRSSVQPVMAMNVSKDNTLALTVSADHLVGRYDLSV
jgi:hypothetical protein